MVTDPCQPPLRSYFCILQRIASDLSPLVLDVEKRWYQEAEQPAQSVSAGIPHVLSKPVENYIGSHPSPCSLTPPGQSVAAFLVWCGEAVQVSPAARLRMAEPHRPSYLFLSNIKIISSISGQRGI